MTAFYFYIVGPFYQRGVPPLLWRCPQTGHLHCSKSSVDLIEAINHSQHFSHIPAPPFLIVEDNTNNNAPFNWCI